jgi:hypothetical protein
LKEFMSKGADTEDTVTDREFVLPLGDEHYKIAMKAQKSTAATLTSAVCEEVLALWANCPQDILLAYQQPGPDPALQLSDFIETMTLGKMASKMRPSSVVVSKYRPKASIEPPESAPEEWRPLVESVLDAETTITSVHKEHKEIREDLERERREAEETLIAGLETMPKGSIQKVCMRDDHGITETYYVRVKPPRKPQKRRISASFYRKALANAVRHSLSEMGAHGSVSDVEVGETVCETLRSVLIEKESAPILAGADLPKRISLDKMRTGTARKVEAAASAPSCPGRGPAALTGAASPA